MKFFGKITFLLIIAGIVCLYISDILTEMVLVTGILWKVLYFCDVFANFSDSGSNVVKFEVH